MSAPFLREMKVNFDQNGPPRLKIWCIVCLSAKLGFGVMGFYPFKILKIKYFYMI